MTSWSPPFVASADANPPSAGELALVGSIITKASSSSRCVNSLSAQPPASLPDAPLCPYSGALSYYLYALHTAPHHALGGNPGVHPFFLLHWRGASAGHCHRLRSVTTDARPAGRVGSGQLARVFVRLSRGG